MTEILNSNYKKIHITETLAKLGAALQNCFIIMVEYGALSHITDYVTIF